MPTPLFSDHYRTLGVHRHADPTVVEAAYRALARRYHPDLHPGDRGAEERLKQINLAYEHLREPRRRAAYNREWDAHHRPPSPPPSSPPPAPPPAAPPPERNAPQPATPRRGKVPWFVTVAGFGLAILLLNGAWAFLSGSPSSAVMPRQTPQGTVPSRPPTRAARAAPTATQQAMVTPGVTTYYLDDLPTPTAVGHTATVTLTYYDPTLEDEPLPPMTSSAAIPASPAWGFVDEFGPGAHVAEGVTETSSVALVPGGLQIAISAPGGLDGLVYHAVPTGGRDVVFRADIGAVSGWGEITLDLIAEGGEPAWTFAVDPIARQWSLYRTSTQNRDLFYWVEPRPFTTWRDGTPETLEVWVVGGVPTLRIDGRDVVQPTGVTMPAMRESFRVGFGAGINPESLSGHGETFTVVVRRVELRAV